MITTLYLLEMPCIGLRRWSNIGLCAKQYSFRKGAVALVLCSPSWRRSNCLEQLLSEVKKRAASTSVDAAQLLSLSSSLFS